MKKREKKDLNPLERSLVESAEFVTALTNSLEDGKLSLPETIKVATELIDLRIIYKEWPTIKEAWNNHDQEDVDNWKQLFCEHFEISDKVAEERIELVLELITVLIRFKDTF